MDAFWNDLKYAARTWLKAPASALVAIATLACGIGAVTAVFSVVNAVLLRPLPYPDSDRLIVLLNSVRGQAGQSPYVSAPRMRAWREHAAGLEDLSVYSLGPAVNVDAAGERRQVAAGRATANFFRLFGVRLVLGRGFTAEEDRPGQAAVAVLSRAWWTQEFGASADIIGRVISVNGEVATVVGVLDDRFDARSLAPGLVTPPDIWLPLRLSPDTSDDANNLLAVARLGAAVPFDTAREHARAAAEDFREAFPRELAPEATFDVTPLADAITGDVRPSLLMLLGAVGARGAAGVRQHREPAAGACLGATP